MIQRIAHALDGLLLHEPVENVRDAASWAGHAGKASRWGVIFVGERMKSIHLVSVAVETDALGDGLMTKDGLSLPSCRIPEPI